MTTTQHIRQEQIAGHSAACDKIAESIGDRIGGLKIGDSVLNRQLNQEIAALRILTKEFMEMKEHE